MNRGLNLEGKEGITTAVGFVRRVVGENNARRARTVLIHNDVFFFFLFLFLFVFLTVMHVAVEWCTLRLKGILETGF